MNAQELQRIKTLVAESDSLVRQIANLKEGMKFGQDAAAVTIRFQPFSIHVAYGDNPDKLCNVCWAKEIADLSGEFRSAFLAIVQKRLDELEGKYDSLSVQPPVAEEYQGLTAGRPANY